MPHRLLKTVQDCEAICEEMRTYVTKRRDVESRRRQLLLLIDCADICTLMAKFLARETPYAKPCARLCANICEACGKECSRFPDAESQNCARVCLNCAKECREFAMS